MTFGGGQLEGRLDGLKRGAHSEPTFQPANVVGHGKSSGSGWKVCHCLVEGLSIGV
jgi:hypothetical protein